MNDPDCTDPLRQPEKTYKPLGEEIEDKSLDFISCLGGLHHIPEERKEAFLDSLHEKLRPGGVILFREHNAPPESEVEALASVVHSFVNAADHIPWEVEHKEVRTFKSIENWSTFMQSHGFTRISQEVLVLKDDPTQNAMIAFVKTPKTMEELKTAIFYRNDCTRPKRGTRATWIEWGNVRSSKQYADFIQNHHAYAFDFIGHIRQHWQHFYHFIRESKQDPDTRLKDLIFSNDMAMNLFILLTAATQYSMSSAATFPSRLIARWQYGGSWREVCHLSALETFEAENEKEYASFIDHTPFYNYPYLSKMKQMWQVIWNSQESLKVKMVSSASALSSSIGFLVKAAISAPIKAFYTSETNQEPETVKILIKDPEDELYTVIKQWEKDPVYDENLKIKVIYQTEDHLYKLVSIPRYKPFTRICGYLNETNELELLEVGNQKEISIDLFLNENIPSPSVPGARFIYEMKKLQDSSNRRYVTYQANVCALKNFKEFNIEYIHE
ncbi:MAG: class I SAM-dependent methyltransferase [Chlamydiales bacterium]|nr:class I SAM-dependent methyltransferase [Chlamydiales bacterium]